MYGLTLKYVNFNYKETEGPPASTLIILLYRGYIFAFDLFFGGQILNPPEVESQLSYIENWCKSRNTSGPGVGALTTTDRTKWAFNRNYLKSLSPKNEQILEIIENALMVCAFDDKEPQTLLEVILFFNFLALFPLFE